jgi:hypothetical protein
MKSRAYSVALSLTVLSIPASASWTSVSHGLTGSVPAITNLVIDASTGSTRYATTSSGADWTNLGDAGLGDANGIFAFAIDPRAPTDMYVATDVGVFRSTDSGVNFAPAGFANTIVSLLAIDPVHPGVLYTATWTYGFPGLYKSVDSGVNWSPINQGLDQIIAAHASVSALLVDPARTDVLYLATSGCGVFRSTDGGASWAAFNDGLTFLDVRSLVFLAATQGSTAATGPLYSIQALFTPALQAVSSRFSRSSGRGGIL